ncbi:MAG: hypothetical protein ACRENK_16445 [Gemmatimonadaceae bacterium]
MATELTDQQVEFSALFTQVGKIFNETFTEVMPKLGKGTLVEQATVLDLFAAKAEHLAAAMRILGERATGVATELLDE